MLVRIRPGWEELRAQVLGQNPRCACVKACLSSIPLRYIACLPGQCSLSRMHITGEAAPLCIQCLACKL